jgi:hypothetical protein
VLADSPKARFLLVVNDPVAALLRAGNWERRQRGAMGCFSERTPAQPALSSKRKGEGIAGGAYLLHEPARYAFVAFRAGGPTKSLLRGEHGAVLSGTILLTRQDRLLVRQSIHIAEPRGFRWYGIDICKVSVEAVVTRRRPPGTKGWSPSHDGES